MPTENHLLSAEPILDCLPCLDVAGIKWVILGGVSGPEFREAQVEHVRSVRDQTKAQGASLFFKKRGGFYLMDNGNMLDGRKWLEARFDVGRYRRRSKEKSMDDDDGDDDHAPDDVEPENEDELDQPETWATPVQPQMMEGRNATEAGLSNGPAPEGRNATGQTEWPTIDEMLLDGHRDSLRLKRATEETYLLWMAQARRLWVSEYIWGYHGNRYKEFARRIGVDYTSAKTLKKFFIPWTHLDGRTYAEISIKRFQAEADRAKARGDLTYKWPGWLKAWQVMEKEYGLKKPADLDADEEEEEAAITPEVVADLKAQLAVAEVRYKSETNTVTDLTDKLATSERLTREREAKMTDVLTAATASEAKAKADAEILDQRLKNERWQREELAENLARAQEQARTAETRLSELEAAQARIRELEAENARLRAALGDHDPDPPNGRGGKTASEAAPDDAPDDAATSGGPSPTNPPAPPVSGLKQVQPVRLSGYVPYNLPPRKRRKREPVDTLAKLKSEAARALKKLHEQGPDLTSRKVLNDVVPLLESIDVANFAGDWRTAFRQTLVRRLWDTVSEKRSFAEGSEEMAGIGTADERDPYAVVWLADHGFKLIGLVIEGPDEDGGGSGTAQESGQDDSDTGTQRDHQLGDTSGTSSYVRPEIVLPEGLVRFLAAHDAAWTQAQGTKWVRRSDYQNRDVDGMDLNDGLRGEILAPVTELWAELRDPRLDDDDPNNETSYALRRLRDRIDALIEAANVVPPETGAELDMMDRASTWSREQFEKEMRESDLARMKSMRQLFTDLAANAADVSPKNQYRRVWIGWLDERIAMLEQPEKDD